VALPLETLNFWEQGDNRAHFGGWQAGIEIVERAEVENVFAIWLLGHRLIAV
jgi:hypothetical protein